MIYVGYFRNYNTSSDPNGQLYKVVVTTNFQSEGEWQYEEIQGEKDGISVLYRIPNDGVELTMSDRPFIVKYEGEGNNIYKPYKCSTAEVGFMIPNFIEDFTLVKKNDILVKLYKLKEGVERYDDHYYNPNTGESLYKQPHWGYINNRRTLIGERYDLGEEYKFYDLEWVGFGTPNTYSQQYVRVSDEYTLQAQDALSTLKYFDYGVENRGIRSFAGFFSVILEKIKSIYEHIYVTDGVQITNSFNKSIFELLYANDGNFFDEDDNPDDCLSVMESLMQFLGCTVIPYRGDLYVLNYDTIGDEMFTFDTFRKVSLPSPSGVMSIVYMNNNTKKVVGELLDLGNDLIAGANTTLSMSNTYKKVKIHNNEYNYDEIIPDLDEDKYLETIFTFDEFGNWIFPTEYHKGNHTYDYETRPCRFYGEIYRTHNIGDMEVTTWDYEPDERNTQTGGITIHTTPIGEPTQYLELWANHIGCKPLDYNFLEVNIETSMNDLLANYDVKRKYFFYTRPIVSTSMPKPTMYTELLHVGNQPAFEQPMLRFKTKVIPMKSDQYLHLKGTWTFYNTAVPYEFGWNGSLNPLLKIFPKYMYVWAKVQIGDEYYLKNRTIATGTSYDYEWSTTPCWCKLYYGGFGFTSSDDNAFENSFSFIKNNFGVDQLAIKLPAFTGGNVRNTNITVTFNRPVGCGKDYNSVSGFMYFAGSTTLEDFDIKIINEEEVQWRKTKDKERQTETDGEYEITMNEDAVDDFPTISMKLSSNYKHGLSMASVFAMNPSPLLVDRYRMSSITRLYNRGNGVMGIPEDVYINEIARTYNQPCIILDVPVFNKVTPFDLFKWQSQFNNKKFVVDVLEYDYANDIANLTLFEKKSIKLKIDTYFGDKVKNFKRNGDNLFGELPPQAKQSVSKPRVQRFYNIYLNEVDRDAILTDTLDNCDLRYLYIYANLNDGCLHLICPEYMEDCVGGEINNLGELIVSYSVGIGGDDDDDVIIRPYTKPHYGGDNYELQHQTNNVNGFLNVSQNNDENVFEVVRP